LENGVIVPRLGRQYLLSKAYGAYTRNDEWQQWHWFGEIHSSVEAPDGEMLLCLEQLPGVEEKEIQDALSGPCEMITQITDSKTLWAAIPKHHGQYCIEFQKIPVHLSQPNWHNVRHWGLREDATGALERAQKFHDTVNKETHCLVKVDFKAVGWMHFMTHGGGPGCCHEPRLHRQVYRAETFENNDWGVWHWKGDIPASAVGNGGGEVVHTELVEIY
jgi:hypothetical protein